MQFWSSLRQHLAFTRQESIAIGFLSIALLVGEVIQWYRSAASPEGPAFDYTALDSEFVARARAGLIDMPEGADSLHRLPSPPPLTPGCVNINAATLEQLVALPGIGPATAGKILAYRKEKGPFTTAEALLGVSGIGPKKLARIRPYLRVE